MATYKEIKGVTVQTLDEDPVVGGVAGATWASGNTTPYSGYYWGSAGKVCYHTRAIPIIN